MVSAIIAPFTKAHLVAYTLKAIKWLQGLRNPQK